MLTSSNQLIALKQGDMRLELIPNLGGSISALTWREHDILRPTPLDNVEITEVSSFPLVPVVNRIPDGRFTFDGKEVDLDANFMGLPDFIHGFGWRNSWRVDKHSETQVELSYRYAAENWPWEFEARQIFTLTDRALRIELSVENLSESIMPADLGFHPYFPTTPDTRLFANYQGHWENNDKGHALRRVPGSYRQDFTKGAGLSEPVMTDQTHYGWDGKATLREQGRPDITIRAHENITNLHIFFPPNGNYAAIEPTLGRGNPFSVLPVEYKVLEPEEALKVWMEIEVSER